jgi:hypothetical protein
MAARNEEPLFCPSKRSEGILFTKILEKFLFLLLVTLRHVVGMETGGTKHVPIYHG